MEALSLTIMNERCIGNLVWQVHHNILTLDNSLDRVASCTKLAIAGIRKLVTSPTKSHMGGMPFACSNYIF
jgi:hypothetical protein